MSLTVGKLKKLLKGIPDNMPVYIADHDHHEFGTNSIAGMAIVVDQSDPNQGDSDFLKRNPEFKIEGKYFVIRP